MHSCMHAADREGPSIGHLGPAYVRGTLLNMEYISRLPQQDCVYSQIQAINSSKSTHTFVRGVVRRN
jgi:hypothetical protein